MTDNPIYAEVLDSITQGEPHSIKADWALLASDADQYKAVCSRIQKELEDSIRAIKAERDKTPHEWLQGGENLRGLRLNAQRMAERQIQPIRRKIERLTVHSKKSKARRAVDRHKALKDLLQAIGLENFPPYAIDLYEDYIDRYCHGEDYLGAFEEE